MTFNQAGRRLAGAVSFDPDSYENLRDDPAATAYAVAVVIVASLIAGIGGLLWARLAAVPPTALEIDYGRFFVRSVLVGSVFQVALWFGWVAITWTYLRHIYRLPDVTYFNLIRTMGFAFAPMAIQVLLVFPVLDLPVGLIAIGGTVACSVLAARAASGSTPGQAMLATMAGFVVFALALGMLGTSDSDLAPGIFALDPNSVSIYMQLGR